MTSSNPSKRACAAKRTTKLTLVWLVVSLFLLNFTIAGPKPACDFTGDSSCNLADINDMFGQGDLVAGVPTTAATEKFDLIDNNVIDGADIDEWLSQAATNNGYGTPFRKGDTDDVGNISPVPRDVDLQDYLNLSGNFDPTGASAPHPWEHGNSDGDSDVDLTDYIALSGNFSPTGYGAEGVPEPSTMVLGLLGLVFGTGIAFCRKRLWS